MSSKIYTAIHPGYELQSSKEQRGSFDWSIGQDPYLKLKARESASTSIAQTSTSLASSY
jgi:hypothetical protein